MELAALALLVCIGQIIAPAKDDVEFRHRIMNPLTEDEFQQLIAPWIDMFYLNHAEHPFMQTKGVKANDVTPMEKLLAGVSGATNCAFVNQPGQGEALCGGCTAIALFNQAPDVNLAFGITESDYLLAGDMNNDGQADVVLYDKGNWLCSFTPSATEYKTPDFANQDITNMQFGTKNDIPLLLDFNGDGYDDMAICSVNDEEVNVNLRNPATKPENNGYSKSGRGSFDETFFMPAGIKPTCVRGVKLGKGSGTGVSTEKQEEAVSVYPVIVEKDASFAVKTNSDNNRISVYNVTGQLVRTIVAGPTTDIPVDGWSSGHYFVRVECGNNVVTKKLIIK